MDGQDRETAGKRKTKNSTSLAEGEKDLAKAKKESEKQTKKEQRLKEKEELVLKQVLALSKHEARMDGSLAISEQEARRKEKKKSNTSSMFKKPPQLNLLNFTCWALLRPPQHVLDPQPPLLLAYHKEKRSVILMIKFWTAMISLLSLHSISQIQIMNQARIKNANLLIHSRSFTMLMARQMSPLLMKL